ncbi:MAG: TetR family transcriptional regulator, partial [Spirochaetes bacterium]|nr:TetR family transcriptional regulator [Spirochaetota bacterium]
MGRPRKDERRGKPTRERILETAIELFAQGSYHSVSVRQITGALGLTEASFYNHFSGKDALFTAIFERLERDLIAPGFAPVDAAAFGPAEDFDLGEFLVAGARRFFDSAGRMTLLTWRILISNQYHFPAARRAVQEHVLDAPVAFFTDLFEKLTAAGLLADGIDPSAAGRTLAARFFEFSCRSNLNAAWGEADPTDRERLETDLHFLAASLQRG